jgi:glycosyltransferase involved in cell wall biosynthesis
MSEAERDRLRSAALARVRARYSWEAVTDEYEALLKQIARVKPAVAEAP